MTWDGALPHDWYGLGGLMVVGLVAIIIAQGVGGGMILKWHRANNRAAVIDREAAAETRAEIHQNAAAIKAQVVNGHTEPLRADLDRLASDVGELKTTLSQLVGQMAEWAPLIPLVRSFAPEIKALRSELTEERESRRGELAEERESRRGLAADVRADIARNRDEVTDLHRRIRDASPG